MTLTSQDELTSPVSASVRGVVLEHLGVPPELLDEVPVLTARFPTWRAIAIQASLDALLPVLEARVLGVPVEFPVYPRLAELLLTPDMTLGPVDYVNYATGPETTMACINAGLILATFQQTPVAVWIHPVREESSTEPRDLAVSVKCTSAETGNAFLDALRAGMEAHNPYRGKSLKLVLDRAGQITEIRFADKPHVDRHQVVLPPGLLDAIETHAVGVGLNAERLRAAGRHLKRGLLLYGPPGTGKTHTIRYLASRLPDATLFVLTGDNMNQVKVVATLMAELAPAIVVLDDVDLIAESRDNAGNAGSQLFNLLDAMDGMRDDIDVLFICTTNRAEELETAISARPGRIDQAVEVALPDAECRARLLELYGEGLDLQLTNPDLVVERTAGVTASFMKELLRRATLFAIDDDPDGTGTATVTDGHVAAALDVLLDPDQPLTAALLGIHRPADPTALQRTKTRGSGTDWCGI
jgi:hypothetical protein